MRHKYKFENNHIKKHFGDVCVSHNLNDYENHLKKLLNTHTTKRSLYLHINKEIENTLFLILDIQNSISIKYLRSLFYTTYNQKTKYKQDNKIKQIKKIFDSKNMFKKIGCVIKKPVKYEYSKFQIKVYGYNKNDTQNNKRLYNKNNVVLKKVVECEKLNRRNAINEFKFIDVITNNTIDL